MLARLDGRVEVEGAEARRRGQDHKVDVGQIDQLLGGVEPGKPAVFRTVDLVLHALNALERAINTVLKCVSDGRELDVGAGHGERLLHGPGAAAPGPDQAHLDRVARRIFRMGGPQAGERGGRSGGEAACPEGIPARDGKVGGHTQTPEERNECG